MRALDAVVIGAGLTGLTLAFYLRKQGKKVLLVEKSSRTGGTIRSFHENGYTFESGPNTGSLANPEIIELFDELKDRCTLQLPRKEAYRRLILKNGKLHALPSGIISGITTPIISVKDKFNILLEPFRKKGDDPDESIAALTLRRLGKSYLTYCVDPFISGIYAGDPNRLTTRYALPKLYALEANHGSFIRGAIAKAKQPKTEREKKVTNAVFSVEGGLSRLTQALTNAIGKENILLNNRSTVISGSAPNWNLRLSGMEVSTPTIISTVGSYALPELFPFAAKSLMNRINNLRYAPVVQVAVGIHARLGKAFQAFGALFPSAEKRNALGILYPSACFENRCPENKALLSVFLGGIRKPEMIDLSDQAIEQLVCDELRTVYRKPDLNPELMRIFRHTHAIPQYEQNSGDRLAAISEFENAYPGIILAGNIRDGISMAQRVKQATDISFFLPD